MLLFPDRKWELGCESFQIITFRFVNLETALAIDCQFCFEPRSPWVMSSGDKEGAFCPDGIVYSVKDKGSLVANQKSDNN